MIFPILQLMVVILYFIFILSLYAYSFIQTSIIKSHNLHVFYKIRCFGNILFRLPTRLIRFQLFSRSASWLGIFRILILIISYCSWSCSICLTSYVWRYCLFDILLILLKMYLWLSGIRQRLDLIKLQQFTPQVAFVIKLMG